MNRALVMAGAVVGLLGASLLIVAGGSSIQPVTQVETVAETAAEPVRTRQPSAVSVPSRMVAPAEIAPPPLSPYELERVEPRAALSPLSLALPPKPKMPDEWAGTLLYRPVASAAGTLDAKGYRIVIAGVEPVEPDEVCTVDGRSWPCGTRARSAFRAMLRGRAVTCDIPPEADRSAIVVSCRIGKQDVGAWLVSNGWARASATGPYAEAGKAAEASRMGVFGAGPATGAPPAPAITGSTLARPPVDPTEPSQ